MNGTAYKDDSQIVILKASKRYATNAGVWVSITDCQPKAG
jgi:Holliday junction resolvase RusA-like endonuclease